LEKFQVGDNKPFSEEDFKMISELGFNFTRLPMDYRIWIKNGDWEEIDEAAFQQIDQAVDFGRKYHIHICMNFHRAPGYTVAKPREASDLWTDPEAQRVCAKHWAFFAHRYRGIPNEQLSFNLMNEPGDIDPEKYRKVVRLLADAIRREDSQRLIIADGLYWGNKPCLTLGGMDVAQATHCYVPMNLTHYKAGWVGQGTWSAEPVWPFPRFLSLLYGPGKEEWRRPLVIEGPFREKARLRIAIRKVCLPCALVVKADGESMLQQTMQGAGIDGASREFTAQIPAGTKSVEVSLASGAWVVLREIGITTGTERMVREFVIQPLEYWEHASATLHFDPQDDKNPFKADGYFDRDWLRSETVDPWKKIQAQGTGVFVGEFGVYNKTPHTVALAWMRDCLQNWGEAGWGWALWNFRGSFGVLDSGRADVVYEDFHGHKLDRELLKLLQGN
jgi:hypothetical protein